MNAAKDGYVVGPDGVRYRVLCVHPPLYIKGRNRGTLLTILNESTNLAYQEEVKDLEASGFTVEKVTAPA